MFPIMREIRGLVRAVPALQASMRSFATAAQAVAHADTQTTASATLKETTLRELSALTARIGQPFKNQALLHEAVTSIKANPSANNRRLAVLGESIVNQTLMEYFYVRYPNLPSASIRDLRKRLCTLEACVSAATSIGLQDAIPKLSVSTGLAKSKIIADSFNALVAAITLDQGNAQGSAFVRDMLLPQLDGVDIAAFVRLAQPKPILRRLLLDNNFKPPTVAVLKESGRATHLPVFIVGVFSGDKKLAEGASFSLHKAEVEAYRAALRTHFSEQLKSVPLPSEVDESPK